MDDVTQALDEAAMQTFVEYVECGNCKDWNKIARAAVLAYAKFLPPAMTVAELAAAIEKERT